MLNRRWFTLIELIVVITILAVLWTIAFISFKWFSLDARDSARLSTIKRIETGLWINKVKTGQYLMPESSFSVTWSTLLYNVWYFWDNLKSKIKIDSATDPLDNWDFVYSVSSDRKSYNLLWKFEKDVSFTTNVLANWENRFLKSFGNWAWILLKNDYSPLDWNITVSWLNQSDNFKFVFLNSEIQANKDNITTLLTHHDKSLMPKDSSLLLYYDMKTLKNWKIKNLAKSSNNWLIFNGAKVVDWSYVSFDGVNDFVAIEGSETMDFSKITVIVNADIDSGFSWDSNIISSHNSSWFAILSSHSFNHKVYFSSHINWGYKLASSDMEFRPNVKSWILAWRYNWSEISLFVDWVKQSNKTSSSWKITLASWVPIILWANPGSISSWDYANAPDGSYFKWNIRSVRIFNRALTDDEIKMYQY